MGLCKYANMEAIEFIKSNIGTDKFFNIKVKTEKDTIFIQAKNITFKDGVFNFDYNDKHSTFIENDILEVTDVPFMVTPISF